MFPVFSQLLRRSITHVSLRWVLTVPFVLPTIGAVALVGYLSYQSGQRAVENLGYQLIADTNARVTQELKTYLHTPLLINRLNRDAVAQGQLDLQNIPELEAALYQRLQQFDQVSAVLFANPQGQLRLVDRLPELYLVAADPPQPNQIRVYRIDEQGKRRQLVTTLKGLDVRSDRPWYQRAVTTGQPGWSPISQYGSQELLTLDASQPVYDRSQKQLLGVFAVHLRLDYLSQFLRGLDISRDGRIIITDQSGAIIATSTGEKNYRFETGTGYHRQFQQLKIDQSQDDLTRSLGQYLRQRSGTLKSLPDVPDLNFHYNGEQQYVKITPFQDQPGLDWQIVTVIPASYFTAAIQDNIHTTILFCLLTLGAAIALGLFAANRLTTRFAQLDRVSRALAAGNLDQRMPTDLAIYELNRLAQTFNQMADRLQQSFHRIQIALEESEAKFTTIFRTSPDPMAIVSLDSQILEVNDSLLEFFGYTRAEMIGQTTLELNLWHSLDERTQYRALLQQQRRVRNLEVTLRLKSGEVKTVLLSTEIRSLEGQDRLIVMQRDISDRKATELALQQSEARYRAIVEDQTDVITRFLPDTTLLFVNDAYCRYFNVRREEIIGRSYCPNIYAADREQVAQQLQTLSRENPTVTSENRVVVNGSIRWMQWVNRMLFDQHGNFLEFQAVGRDITPLKQTEEARRKSEANLLHAQKIAHVGSWDLDLTTEKITWSEELFRIFGLDPAQAEPSYAELLAMIPAPDRDTLIKAIDQTIANNTPYEVEHRICRLDGTIRYVISKGQVMLDDQQEVLKFYGTVLDITDRKQFEFALQHSEAKLNNLLSNAGASIASFRLFPDKHWEYEYWSKGCEMVFGYTAEEFLAEPSLWFSRVLPADIEQKRVVNLESFMVAGSTTTQGEYRFFHKDGRLRWSSFQATSRPDAASGWIVTVVDVDITERKQLEASLRSQAEEERLLATITQNIRQSLELEQILATTVTEVQQTLQADRALIFRLNSDRSGQVIQAAGVPAYAMTDQMRWEDEHFSAACYAYYQQGMPRIVPDVATDEWAQCLAEFMQTAGVKSKVVAPIVQSQKASTPNVWGLLVVHACSHYRQWQDSEADFLQQICNQLAIAIDQANLYQQLQAELTERKQAEAALREREAMLRAIGDNLPKGFIYQRVYEPGKGSYYSYVSAGVERLLGLKPEDILADPRVTRTVGFEEELTHADQVVQESLQHLTPIELQMQHRTPAGEIGWSSIRSTPRRLEDGRIVWDGIEVDITDLKRAEAALRTSEEQFRQAFDDAPTGVSLVTMTGQFVKVNSRYCDLLEYTEAELLALTFQEITHPADLEKDLEGLHQMLMGKTDSFQLEKRYITKQGTIVPVLMNAALIRDQNGQPLYSVGHIQDIRDRLKVERMKNEFISIMSHELRTPLTSIQGALDILSSGIYDNRPEKARHMLKIAINNSERLVRLVNDILTLERLESGKVQLAMEPCDVSDLMQQAVEGIQAIADQSTITLCLTPLAATLWAAPDAIIQALTNLLSNAIKFSAPGDTVWIKAELRTKEHQDAGALPPLPDHFDSSMPLILFTVQDQGRGIPEDKLEIIFEQFQQVDVSDACKKGGTGLGLAICKNIVQQHGGKIWVESILGQGSSFYIALPLTDSSIDEAKKELERQ